MKWVDIGEVDEFKNNTPRAVLAAGLELVVIQQNQKFYCYTDRCTHETKNLSSGWVDGMYLVCAAHRGKFDLKTGESTALPATGHLEKWQIKVENGRIQVQV